MGGIAVDDATRRAALADGWDLSLLKEPAARVADVAVSGPLSVRVKFTDGLTGEMRFDESYLEGVFSPLRDPAFFAQVGIERGYMGWPGELDFCADAMYIKIAMHGEWVLRRQPPSPA